MNKQNKLIDTENQLVVTRGEGVEDVGEKGESSRLYGDGE